MVQIPDVNGGNRGENAAPKSGEVETLKVLLLPSDVAVRVPVAGVLNVITVA
jgi:hypothetical protein